MNKKRLAFAGKKDKPLKTQSLEEENASVLFAMNRPTQKNEHQSDVRESNILPLNNDNHPQQFKKRKVIQPIAIASISAILIGSVLGIVMLNMFANLEDSPVNQVSHIDSIQKSNTTDSDRSGSTDTEHTTMTLEAINGFVLQAGVFSTKQNAESWAESFVNNGFPTVVWERDSKYFLLAGIAHTRERAEELAADFKQHNLEVFIKEWNTPKVEIEVTSKEKEWLLSLNELWNSSLVSAAEQGVIAIQGWENLITNLPDENDTFASIKNIVSDIQHDGEQITGSEVTKMLLSVWQTIEKLGNEI